jgi:hypothetical protein
MRRSKAVLSGNKVEYKIEKWWKFERNMCDKQCYRSACYKAVHIKHAAENGEGNFLEHKFP